MEVRTTIRLWFKAIKINNCLTWGVSLEPIDWNTERLPVVVTALPQILFCATLHFVEGLLGL
jgi:hypothetical protein